MKVEQTSAEFWCLLGCHHADHTLWSEDGMKFLSGGPCLEDGRPCVVCSVCLYPLTSGRHEWPGQCNFWKNY